MNSAQSIAAIIVAGLVAITTHPSAAQPPDPELFEVLRRADSLIFEEGFNKCNFPVLEKVMHPSLEFLHDENGIQDRAAFFQAVRESICSTPAKKPIRKLVEGSLLVYPLKNEGKLYGAVQLGAHEFFIAEAGKKDRLTSRAKFVHTWLLDHDQWRLYRVVSYDHQQPK